MVRFGSIPPFYIDSLPDVINTECRELLRSIEISAQVPDIFVWLKQLRVAPYSYDILDNRGRKSPGYIIENLPPLKVNSHFLLAFHIIGFEENSFIVCRFCEPVNPPVSLYMKDMVLEYRIEDQGCKRKLWCKIKGYFNTDISSRGFFFIYSFVNKIMMARQLKNIRKYSELLAQGRINTGKCEITDFYAGSGLHWWVFCRRKNCKGLVI